MRTDLRDLPLITLFTSPKPFEGHIGVIQRNALLSWKQLGPAVEILMIGDEQGMKDVARELHVGHIPGVKRNAEGTPLISSIFSLAEDHGRGEILCYLNGDIILLDDFLPAIRKATQLARRFLLVGQRWDLDIHEILRVGDFREHAIRRRLEQEGRLHPPSGSDYFVYPRGLFSKLPDFALGRAGWDNWMIYRAQALGALVVEASSVLTVIHQNHDYAHLPGGQPHYRLPESQKNVELGGGREALFTLRECPYRLTEEGLARRRPHSIREWKRQIVAWTVLRFGPGRLARIVRALLSPIATVHYFALRAVGRQVNSGRDGSMTSSGS